MVRWVLSAIGRTVEGITVAIRARPRLFLATAIGVFVLHVFVPPVVLSLARKPWDYFTFNPWLSRLPEWLASSDVPLWRKFEFLPSLALFWFSADNPIEGVEWGFLVDVTDLVRFVFTSLLLGAYFALWFYRRDHLMHAGWGARVSRHGGVAGALVSILGLSTGPCSVVGCGVPVLPVVGLALTGLSSGMLKFLGGLSRVAIVVVLFTMTLSVVYIGWLVGVSRGERSATPA